MDAIQKLLEPNVLEAIEDKTKLWYRLASQIDWDVWPESQDVDRLKVLVKLGVLILGEVDTERELRVKDPLFQNALELKRENDQSIKMMAETFGRLRPTAPLSAEKKREQIDALAAQLEAAIADAVASNDAASVR